MLPPGIPGLVHGLHLKTVHARQPPHRLLVERNGGLVLLAGLAQLQQFIPQGVQAVTDFVIIVHGIKLTFRGTQDKTALAWPGKHGFKGHMQNPVLSLDKVSKNFGGHWAVKDLCLHIEPGTITGFLGPNGAGKSTSLRLGLGILAPTSGEVRLFGQAPSYESLDKVGFLPEERGLYRKMQVLALITHFGRLKGLSARNARTRGQELLERLELGHAGKMKVRELSKGMAQKVQIVAALVHDPQFVILDEPFSGLDPVNQKVLEDLIRDLHAHGATILFSTHVMEHAERLCDRIVLLSRGEKIFDGSVDAALGTLPRMVRLDTSMDADPGAVLGSLATRVEEIPAELDDTTRHVVELAHNVSAQDVLKACVEGGLPLRGFEPAQRHLHDVFVHLVEGQS